MPGIVEASEQCWQSPASVPLTAFAPRPPLRKNSLVPEDQDSTDADKPALSLLDNWHWRLEDNELAHSANNSRGSMPSFLQRPSNLRERSSSLSVIESNASWGKLQNFAVSDLPEQATTEEDEEEEDNTSVTERTGLRSPSPVYRSGSDDESPSKLARLISDDEFPEELLASVKALHLNNEQSVRAKESAIFGTQPMFGRLRSASLPVATMIDTEVSATVERADTSSPRTGYYEVEFKRLRRGVFAGTWGAFNVGDFVKVEADRGFDVGQITRAALRATEFGAERAGATTFANIVAQANSQEMHALRQKMLDEMHVLEICRWKVSQRMLPMRVIDAEFQFDRHKLTFFFYAERRIDFRELVRDLFNIFKTRIWLQQVRRPAAPSTVLSQ
ncbi:TPA: hypothetical protein N0F65_006068 [Lagenidium giganteum]|uniref:PSP1 C-terminal domain-containing protein n=1 Tax=Lagenidium giganteum TaxID=4803 RepID=A0AAV2YLU4_9STRA|nr:TPA: hypothetical protein N0F65_006068 [Lagenidium giganteum]